MAFLVMVGLLSASFGLLSIARVRVMQLHTATRQIEDIASNIETEVLLALNDEMVELQPGWQNDSPDRGGCDDWCAAVSFELDSSASTRVAAVESFALIAHVLVLRDCLWNGSGSFPAATSFQPTEPLEFAHDPSSVPVPSRFRAWPSTDDWLCEVKVTRRLAYRTFSPLQYHLVYRSHRPTPTRFLPTSIRNTDISFFADDQIGGPIHYSPRSPSEAPGVLVCGAFSRTASAAVEVASDYPSVFQSSSASCPAPPPPNSSDKHDVLPLDIPGVSDTGACPTEMPEWMEPGIRRGDHSRNTITVSNLASLPDGAIIWRNGNIRITYPPPEMNHHFRLNNITVIARGDIIIEVPDQGPYTLEGSDIFALIAGCNIRLGDPVRAPVGIVPGERACAEKPASLTTDEGFDECDDLTLRNVAILAPNGGIFANRWDEEHGHPAWPVECFYDPPTLTIEGTIVTTYRLLTGRWRELRASAIPPARLAQLTAEPNCNLPSGDPEITHGYRKVLSYPSEFAEFTTQPAWWPNLTGQRWHKIG